jgi:hypothetical protein
MIHDRMDNDRKLYWCLFFICIGGIVALEALALYLKIDGTALAAVVAALAFIMGKVKLKSTKKAG